MMVLSTGNRWIPAYAGMTVAGLGMTVIDRQLPFYTDIESCLSCLSMFESDPLLHKAGKYLVGNQVGVAGQAQGGALPFQ